MSIALTTDFSGIERLQRRIDRLANPDLQGLGEVLGAMSESQARKRLSEDKAAPDGTPWAPWSKEYAGRQKGGKSYLEGEGNLIDSITFDVQGGRVLIGSDLEYAAIHQYGGTPDMKPGPAGIPARPYLGWGDDDLAAIQAEADAWLDRHLEQA